MSMSEEFTLWFSTSMTSSCLLELDGVSAPWLSFPALEEGGWSPSSALGSRPMGAGILYVLAFN